MTNTQTHLLGWSQVVALTRVTSTDLPEQAATDMERVYLPPGTCRINRRRGEEIGSTGWHAYAEDGAAEIDWASGVTFRRCWGGRWELVFNPLELKALKGDAFQASFETALKQVLEPVAA